MHDALQNRPKESNAATVSTYDGPALDDAENPLQLLARASDLRLVSSAYAADQASNLQSPLSPHENTIYSDNSSRNVHSFFLPMKASLDVGPEIDPVDLGLISLEDAKTLFALCGPLTPFFFSY